ncbi:MAG: hypothetical protein LIP01_05485 [Tannerellaceae bacterium]|nr:hypothetical protein [Tannerellaceae bacterium]
MRVNGSIRVIVNKGGGRTEYGEPIPVVCKKGKHIPGLVRIVTHHHKGRYEDTTFKVSSYEILIEKRAFSGNRIELYLDGCSLGEYEVQSVEPLASYGRIKIVV